MPFANVNIFFEYASKSCSLLFDLSMFVRALIFAAKIIR